MVLTFTRHGFSYLHVFLVLLKLTACQKTLLAATVFVLSNFCICTSNINIQPALSAEKISGKTKRTHTSKTKQCLPEKRRASTFPSVEAQVTHTSSNFLSVPVGGRTRGTSERRSAGQAGPKKRVVTRSSEPGGGKRRKEKKRIIRKEREKNSRGVSIFFQSPTELTLKWNVM